jgi:hypothetical protein
MRCGSSSGGACGYRSGSVGRGVDRRHRGGQRSGRHVAFWRRQNGGLPQASGARRPRPVVARAARHRGETAPGRARSRPCVAYVPTRVGRASRVGVATTRHWAGIPQLDPAIAQFGTLPNDRRLDLDRPPDGPGCGALTYGESRPHRPVQLEHRERCEVCGEPPLRAAPRVRTAGAVKGARRLEGSAARAGSSVRSVTPRRRAWRVPFRPFHAPRRRSDPVPWEALTEAAPGPGCLAANLPGDLTWKYSGRLRLRWYSNIQIALYYRYRRRLTYSRAVLIPRSRRPDAFDELSVRCAESGPGGGP